MKIKFNFLHENNEPQIQVNKEMASEEEDPCFEISQSVPRSESFQKRVMTWGGLGTI